MVNPHGLSDVDLHYGKMRGAVCVKYLNIVRMEDVIQRNREISHSVPINVDISSNDSVVDGSKAKAKKEGRRGKVRAN